jgi:hypothetical protein
MMLRSKNRNRLYHFGNRRRPPARAPHPAGFVRAVAFDGGTPLAQSRAPAATGLARATSYSAPLAPWDLPPEEPSSLSWPASAEQMSFPHAMDRHLPANGQRTPLPTTVPCLIPKDDRPVYEQLSRPPVAPASSPPELDHAELDADLSVILGGAAVARAGCAGVRTRGGRSLAVAGDAGAGAPARGVRPHGAFGAACEHVQSRPHRHRSAIQRHRNRTRPARDRAPAARENKRAAGHRGTPSAYRLARR